MRGARAAVLIGVMLLLGVGLGFPLGRFTAPVERPPEDQGQGLRGEILLGAVSTVSDDAEYMNPAMEIALEEVNEYARKLGLNVTFRIRFEDAGASDGVALQRFRSLHEAGAEVILGMWWSSQLEACRGYANENHVLVISSASTAPSLAIPDDYVFRLVPTDVAQSRALARMMASRGIKAAVILQEDNAWGEGLGGGFAKRFQELGGVVVDRIRYPQYQVPSAADLARAAESVRQALGEYGEGRVAVEAVSMGEIGDTLPMAASYPELVSVPWFGSDGYVRWVSLVEEVPELALKTGQLSPLSAVMESPRLEAFAGKFAARTGLRLRHYEPESYDSVWVAALAVLQVGKYDADALRKVLPDVCSTYFGASGWIRLDENGDKATGDYDIYGVTGENGVIDWRRVGRYSGVRDEVEWLAG